MVLLEACVDTVESAVSAEHGGADRVELCADLADAGTTPSAGTLRLALERLTIQVFPIIRPRGGGFVYSETDIAVMRADLKAAAGSGCAGAVVGALNIDGDVATDVAATLRDAAPGVQLTFHRAFDVCRDPHQALETLIRIGFDRVLTSGQAATAWEGRALIASLVGQANGRITILAGGGIDERHIADLVRETGVTEVHIRGTSPRRDPGPEMTIPFRKALAVDQGERAVTDPARIRALRALV
ncbi:MAG: copper homeostasis protein CutC [Gemmatimonadales bacterium]